MATTDPRPAGARFLSDFSAEERAGVHRVFVERREALYLHEPDPADPIGVLAAVGGLEHAGLVGFLLAAGALRDVATFDSAGVTDKGQG